MAIEQKRYEECSVAPGPRNDVMVGEILGVWTDSLIAVLKTVGKENWPIAHSARALNGLFRTVPKYAEMRILSESNDALAALLECEDMERRQLDLVANVNCLQRREFFLKWQDKRIQGTYRKFEEDHWFRQIEFAEFKPVPGEEPLQRTLRLDTVWCNARHLGKLVPKTSRLPQKSGFQTAHPRVTCCAESNSRLIG
jgi:hypothetical protein